MRINDQVPHEILGPQSREVQQVDRREAGERSEKAEIRRDGDEATLSQEARLMQRIRQTIDKVPDVREGKIAALRQQIQDGTYKINRGALIDALLGGHRTDT
ncbi:MAG: flagellar biosynthesis anti-sigma factor FlgM [Anaerolineae bacterium]